METGRHGQTSLLIFFFYFSFAQCIFSFYNSCFSSLLMFSSLLLCEIVSGLRGVCCKGIEARYPQAILSTNAYIIHSFVS